MFLPTLRWLRPSAPKAGFFSEKEEAATGVEALDFKAEEEDVLGGLCSVGVDCLGLLVVLNGLLTAARVGVGTGDT